VKGRPRAHLCAALVALVTLAGVTYTSPASAGGRAAAIRSLLDRRAEAWAERDESGFMATVSRDSRDFRRRQRDLFEWSAEVPFASYRLDADWERTGDLATGRDRRRYAADDVVLLHVLERYRIEGYDPAPAVEDLFFTFVERNGTWSIANDSDVADVGLLSARHLWDFGPVEAQRSEHFLLLRHPCGSKAGCVEIPPTFLATAEDALDQVARYWTVPWVRRVAIVAPSTTAELGRIVQATFELDDFVAFAYSTYDPDQDFHLTGHRIMLNWAQIAGRDEASLRSILSHELLHIATRGSTGPFVPTFVEEGIADYVGHDADPAALTFLESEVAAGRFDRRIPEDFEFLTGDGTDIFLSYQEAHSALRYIATRWGLDRMVRFYRRLGGPKLAPGTVSYHIDQALRDVVGLSYSAFESAWASSIQS
jgi:hypothetical protein